MREPEPPDRVPQFSILGVMLLTASIAAVLGMLQAAPRFAPLVSVVALIGWLSLEFVQPGKKSNQHICELWAGVVLPAALAGLIITDPQLKDRLVYASGVFLIAPYSVWYISRHFQVPRTSAFLCGCLAVTSFYLILGSLPLSFLAARGSEKTIGNELAPTASFLLAMTGIVVASLAAGVAHLLAMRKAWRRSYRNGKAFLIAIWAPFATAAFAGVITEVVRKL